MNYWIRNKVFYWELRRSFLFVWKLLSFIRKEFFIKWTIVCLCSKISRLLTLIGLILILLILGHNIIQIISQINMIKMINPTIKIIWHQKKLYGILLLYWIVSCLRLLRNNKIFLTIKLNKKLIIKFRICLKIKILRNKLYLNWKITSKVHWNWENDKFLIKFDRL